jgi:hypothetical protein
MDDLIAGTGVAYRALTNPSFMDNIAGQAGAIKNQGMWCEEVLKPAVLDQAGATAS